MARNYFNAGDAVVATAYLRSAKGRSVRAYPRQELTVLRRNRGEMVWVCSRLAGNINCFYCPSRILKLKN